MSGKQASTLRRWIRRYGVGGTLLAGCCLGLHHLWTKRRMALVCALIGMMSLVMLLRPHPAVRAIPSPVLPTQVQPAGPEQPASDPEPSAENLSLLPAATKGDNAEIRRLLRLGADVDEIGAEGTVLVYAAKEGHLSSRN